MLINRGLSGFVLQIMAGGIAQIDILKLFPEMGYSKVAWMKGELRVDKKDHMIWSREASEKESYKNLEPAEGRLMSVSEMGRMLGLKKTDRYWLVHKNYFETQMFLGKIWIVRESFERWYANQVKYRKVRGEEPGAELKGQSYSAREIAQMLGLHEATVYEIIKRDRIETIEVDYWKRVPKEAFERWYAGQDRYRTQEDRERDAALEKESITMPEMAHLLGIDRAEVYGILKSRRYKDLFETFVVAGRKRITRESFYRFLDSQEKYRLNVYPEIAGQDAEENRELSNFRQKKHMETGTAREIGNTEYLTMEEAVLIAKVSRTTVYDWIRDGCFPVKKVGKSIRIERSSFERWLRANGRSLADTDETRTPRMEVG